MENILHFGSLNFFFGMLLINSYYIESFAKKYIYCDIEKLPKKDTALILGTTKYIDKGKVNYFYKYRIDAGVKLFKAKKVTLNFYYLEQIPQNIIMNRKQ